VARLRLGVVDIALWDLAGKLDGRPIYQRLGGRDKPLPAYASTSVGDGVAGGFDTPQAYADFAHRKLRELIRTQLLELEHVRGLEAHVDMIVGGTGFVRAAPDYYYGASPPRWPPSCCPARPPTSLGRRSPVDGAYTII
jgi:hypothetical protein